MTLPRDLKAAYMKMFRDIKPDLFVTLRTYPECPVSDETMLYRLKGMDAYIARRTLGRQWAKKPDSMRMHGVFVLEHGKSGVHPHWHGILNVPKDIYRYRGLIDLGWCKAGKGSTHFDFPDETNALTGWSDYILKEMTPANSSNIVFTNMLRK